MYTYCINNCIYILKKGIMPIYSLILLYHTNNLLIVTKDIIYYNFNELGYYSKFNGLRSKTFIAFVKKLTISGNKT